MSQTRVTFEMRQYVAQLVRDKAETLVGNPTMPFRGYPLKGAVTP